MNELRSLFARARVLVVGDLMVDEYLFGTGAPYFAGSPGSGGGCASRQYVPGGAGNVAANVRSLGAQVRLVVGVCGRDGAAETLRLALEKFTIDNSHIVYCAEKRADRSV